MMKSILVALDGSAAAYAALTEAVAWAGLLQAELRGYFVEDEQRFVTYPAGISAEGGVPIAVPLPEDEMEAEAEKARREGDEIQSAFETAVKGLNVRCTFERERGGVNDVLTREGRAADLIVVGRRGRHEPSESRRPGPTTETLIHNALRPVLVVPDEPRSQGGVLFAYDGSRGVQRVLVPGTELARTKSAAVHVIAIGDDPEHGEALRRTLERYWRPYDIAPAFNYVQRKGRFSAMIVAEAAQTDCGMIVMGAFGHNPIRELFFGSTTLEVLEHATCPVLLMA